MNDPKPLPSCWRMIFASVVIITNPRAVQPQPPQPSITDSRSVTLGLTTRSLYYVSQAIISARWSLFDIAMQYCSTAAPLWVITIDTLLIVLNVTVVYDTAMYVQTRPNLNEKIRSSSNPACIARTYKTIGLTQNHMHVSVALGTAGPRYPA
jgi:hypothetical protein